MNIYLRHVKNLDFRGTGMFSDSKWDSFYYKKDQKKRRITIICNLSQVICYFDLTRKQFAEFEAGKLSLVPPECCNPRGGSELYDPKIHFRGEIKNKNHLFELLSNLEKL